MKKKMSRKVKETTDAYKRDKGDNIITDSLGMYTGRPYKDGEVPVQDADDL